MTDELDASLKSDTKPPYVPYKTFQNFINSLRASGVPGRIDRTVLPGLSGASQSYLLIALRFLGFIEPVTGTPTAEFVRLVKEPQQERAILETATRSSYHFIFHQGFNLEAATEGQLIEKFKGYDLGGDTVRKCLSFFVLLCNAAGIKLSPHIRGANAANGNTASSGTRRPYRKRNRAYDDTPATEPQRPTSLQELLLSKFPSFDPEWDAETQKKWFDSFEKFVKAAQGTQEKQEQ